MDPVSIAGLVIAVSQVVRAVCKVSHQAKEAKSDIRSLCDQLFAFKGVLEYIEQQRKAGQDDDIASNSAGGVAVLLNSADFSKMLRSSKELLDHLIEAVTTPQGFMRRAMHVGFWPIAKSEIQASIARLDSIKGWFLLALMTDGSSVYQGIRADVSSVLTIVADEERTRKRKDDEGVKCGYLKALAPVSTETVHQRALGAYQPGTGAWFLNGALRDWLAPSGAPSPVLWLNGKSGAGKTTLFCASVEETQAMQTTHQIAVARFYCSYGDLATHELSNILGSFISQLVRRYPKLYDMLGMPTYESSQTSLQPTTQQPTLNVLERYLTNIAFHFEKLYLFVDAINECSKPQEVATSLVELCSKSTNIHLMMSSTPEAELGLLKEQYGRMLTITNMPSSSLEPDIRAYVEHQVSALPNLQSLSDHLKRDILSTLVSRSDGMFRWVQCQVDSLAKQRTGKAVKKALEELPKTLNDTYISILCRIDQADRQYAKDTLVWLALAQSPLSLAELCEAIIIDEGDSQIDDDSRIHPCEAVIPICQGLVVHDEATSRVSLAHSSIRDFLVSEEIKHSRASFYSLDISEASRTVIRKSVSYLMLDEFSQGYRGVTALEAWKDSYPLLEYASLWPYLARHLRCSSLAIGPEELALIMRFLSTSAMDGGGNFRTWVSLLYDDPDRAMIQATQPLYCAASFGIEPVVAALLNQKEVIPVDLNALGGRHSSTALSAAAYYGHAGVVKMLLASGADSNIPDIQGLTPLFWAETRIHRDCAELLRGAGACDPLAKEEPDLDTAQPGFTDQQPPRYIMNGVRRERVSRKKHRDKIRIWKCSLCPEGIRSWPRRHELMQHIRKIHPEADVRVILQQSRSTMRWPPAQSSLRSPPPPDSMATDLPPMPEFDPAPDFAEPGNESAGEHMLNESLHELQDPMAA